MIIVSIGLVCLLGAAAATIDVGHMLMLMSQAQAVADASALAAATGPIVDHTTEVRDRAQAIIEANNEKVSLPTTCPTDGVTAYDGDANVPGYGRIGVDEEAVRVRVRITSPYLFGRVLGLTNAVIERQATALRTGASGGDAVMFAIDPSENSQGIDISGAHGLFEGLIHSNSKIDISGGDHHFTGLLEWNNRLRVTGSGHLFDIGDIQSTIKDPPVTYQLSDFEPFDYEINGDYNVPSSGTIPPGTYRVHGDVHISGSDQRLENVTFIADGDIHMSGSNQYYTPAQLGVFAYSLSNSAHGAISIDGSAPGSKGTLYAPAGNVTFAGSNMTFTSMIGWTISVSGNGFHVKSSLQYGNGEFSVKLIG